MDPACLRRALVMAYDSVAEARAGIGAYLRFYNDERLHQARA